MKTLRLASILMFVALQVLAVRPRAAHALVKMDARPAHH